MNLTFNKSDGYIDVNNVDGHYCAITTSHFSGFVFGPLNEVERIHCWPTVYIRVHLLKLLKLLAYIYLIKLNLALLDLKF